MDAIGHLITLPLIQIAAIKGDNRRNVARGGFLCRAQLLEDQVVLS